MAEGNSSYHGLAVGLYGQHEIKQLDDATSLGEDILTITGSTGTQTGDFLVLQTGAGTENFVVSASGAVTGAAGATFTTGLSAAGLTLTVASTLVNGLTINVTSTGAFAAGTTGGSAILVQGSTKSVLNSIITYVSTCTGGEVGSCNSFLAAQGSKAPTYLLSVGGSAIGVGNPTTNGLITSGQYLVSALATTVPIQLIKVLLGDSPWYIPLITSTCFAAS